MSTPSYELWYTTDTGSRIQSLDTALWWQASRQVNNIGHFQMGLPATFDENLLKPDRMVQIWRQPSGGRLGLWRVYFLRGWRLQHEGDQERITIWGADCNDLLRRRIAACFSGVVAGTSFTTIEADNLMKDVVTNSQSDAAFPVPAAGSRAWADLTVAADLTDAPQVSIDCAWDTLLTDSGAGILPALADASADAGTNLFFDVVADSVSPTSITFQFRTYTGQPGMDVSDRVVFNREDLNLRDPFIEWDHTAEVNYVYAGGPGVEDARIMHQVYNADRYGASHWNRCESFVDARNQSVDAAVWAAGRQGIREGRPRIRAGGVPLDTVGTRFGLDWDFGYRVAMKYRRLQFDCIVRAVVLSMDSSGQETIDARLDYES